MLLQYLISGLHVQSEFRLSTAPPMELQIGGVPDVRIEFCDDVGTPPEPHFASNSMEARERDFVFRPCSELAFRIRDGAHISIARGADVHDVDINLFLVGSAWGVLCHQRGLLPLHCSAVRMGGGAVAFTGKSGAGKSTLAAGLARRGYVHLCDDVGVIADARGQMCLHPMPKGLKLWRDAADALGLELGPRVSADPALAKFHVSLPRQASEPPAEIVALYELVETDGDCRITRRRGSAHFEGLYSSIYRLEWLNMLRDPGDVFRHVAKLPPRFPMFEFARPRDMARFDGGLDVLETHMTQLTRDEAA